MPTPAIEIRDLWFAYDGEPVLRDVNLSVRQGDFLALLGPNGGGKTTLVKLVLGLLRPQRGTIRILGHPPAQGSHRIGYMPQHLHLNFGFPISVFDIVLMGRLRHRRRRWSYSSEDRQAARQALEQMEMWQYRDRLVHDLSGGQRQRVFIARALAAAPDILCLDEPTAGVDAKHQTDLFELLRRLNQTMTIVVVSHDIGVISSYVTAVACVNRTLYFHDGAEISKDMLEMAYSCCPVDLVAHGLPHRVLKPHEDH